MENIIKKRRLDSNNNPKANFEVLKRIKNAIECPVCLSVPRNIPIYRCKNGHILCNECENKLIKCPVCSVNLSKDRCLISEKIISELPYDCKFSSEGCTMELKREDMSKHEKVCSKRLIQCPMANYNANKLNCNEELQIDPLIEHLKKHGIHEKNNLTCNIAYTIKEDVFERESAAWLMNHFTNNGHHFYRVLVKKAKFWYSWVYVLYVEGNPENYEYKVVLKPGGSETKQSQWTNDCIPLEDFAFECFTNFDKGCFLITNNVVKEFMTNGKLNMDLTIETKR